MSDNDNRAEFHFFEIACICLAAVAFFGADAFIHYMGGN